MDQVDSSVEWIGKVPSTWAIEPLAHRFRERNTTVSDAEYPPLSVTRDGILPQLKNVAKTGNGDARKLVRRGDLAINSRSDRRGSAGISDRDGSVSVITTVLVPHDLDGRFAHYLLRSQGFQEEYYRHGSGIVADLWSTRWSAMKTIRMAFPPPDEQRAIAEVLDHETAEIDAFIHDQEELIRLLAERRAATISRAVTKGLNPNSPMKDSEVDWLGEVPADWTVTRLSRYFDVTLGKMLDEGKAAAPGSSTLPYVRAANIQEAGLDITTANTMAFTAREQRQFSIRRGDLLVVEGGAIGVNAHISSDMPNWGFQKTVNRIRTRGHGSTRFAGYALDSLRFAGVLDMVANKSTIAHLTAEKLERLVLAWPPTVEQEQIAEYLTNECANVDGSIEDARRAIALLQERRAALISAAVTGKIDVRERVKGA